MLSMRRHVKSLAKWVLRKLLFKSGEHRRESFVNGQKKSDNPEQLQLGLLLDGASANVKRGSSVRLVSFRKRPHQEGAESQSSHDQQPQLQQQQCFKEDGKSKSSISSGGGRRGGSGPVSSTPELWYQVNRVAAVACTTPPLPPAATNNILLPVTAMTVNGTGGGGAQYARTPVATFHLRHWGYTFLRRNGGVSGMPGAIMERATTSDADDSFSTNISSIINQVQFSSPSSAEQSKRRKMNGVHYAPVEPQNLVGPTTKIEINGGCDEGATFEREVPPRPPKMRAPIGAEWNKLTDKTKCKWENLAAQNKIRYETELNIYTNSSQQGKRRFGAAIETGRK